MPVRFVSMCCTIWQTKQKCLANSGIHRMVALIILKTIWPVKIIFLEFLALLYFDTTYTSSETRFNHVFPGKFSHFQLLHTSF